MHSYTIIISWDIFTVKLVTWYDIVITNRVSLLSMALSKKEIYISKQSKLYILDNASSYWMLTGFRTQDKYIFQKML